jgi:F0F1-type ATP synthase membrane subunit b/b'
MTRRSLSLVAFVACLFFCATRPVCAQSDETEQAERGQAAPAVAQHSDHAAPAGAQHELAAPHEATATHEAASAHEQEENLSFSDINWYQGLIGESDDPQPSLLFRPKGMPTPFLATFINWLVLVWLIVMVAKKQLPAALKKRKASLVSGMQEAARVKTQAQGRLGELETKLSHVDQEIERIKAEMQRASESERERVLREAEERAGRMQRDAARLIESELDSAKEELRRDVVNAALRQAADEVGRQMTSHDQQRLFEDALGSLKGLPSKSLGGRA